MRSSKATKVVAVLFLATAFPCVLCKIQNGGKRVPKQIHSSASVVDSDQDHSAAESGFGGGIEGHSKYFQYQHNPEHDHYEFGYRRGNDHHFQERYEKAHPHAGHFKTKARWGDKHGGYGEHYWDYNHDGHDHEGGGGDEGGDGGYSAPVPNYQQPEVRVKKNAVPQDLVLDTTTGNVLDRTTGQRYVLQPV